MKRVLLLLSTVPTLMAMWMCFVAVWYTFTDPLPPHSNEPSGRCNLRSFYSVRDELEETRRLHWLSGTTPMISLGPLWCAGSWNRSNLVITWFSLGTVPAETEEKRVALKNGVTMLWRGRVERSQDARMGLERERFIGDAVIYWYFFPLPLFLAIVAAYPVTALVWILNVRRMRRRRGQCLCCSYQLTGNVSGVCPECGTPVRHFAMANVRAAAPINRAGHCGL